jgi:hypothetical protein
MFAVEGHLIFGYPFGVKRRRGACDKEEIATEVTEATENAAVLKVFSVFSVNSVARSL